MQANRIEMGQSAQYAYGENHSLLCGTYSHFGFLCQYVCSPHLHLISRKITVISRDSTEACGLRKGKAMVV